MKTSIIPYGTTLFVEFENDSNIKLKDAYDIHKSFIEQHKDALPPCTRSGGLLYFAHNSEYVFGYFDPLDEVGRYSPNLVRVDAGTGEAHICDRELPLIDRQSLPRRCFGPHNR